MSNVIIKESTSKIDHPSRDPNRAKIESAAKKRVANGQLKFENEAEKRDYEKRVASNKFNTYGMPCFYPPEEIKSSFSSVRPMVKCKTVNCGGGCTAIDNYICYRCGEQTLPTEDDNKLW